MENGRCFEDPTSGVCGAAYSLYLALRKQDWGKILTMLLRKGLELWSEGPRKRYIECMEILFQQQILGSPTSPAHWSLLHERGGGGERL
jgi:hypothetical protein